MIALERYVNKFKTKDDIKTLHAYHEYLCIYVSNTCEILNVYIDWPKLLHVYCSSKFLWLTIFVIFVIPTEITKILSLKFLQYRLDTSKSSIMMNHKNRQIMKIFDHRNMDFLPCLSE